MVSSIGSNADAASASVMLVPPPPKSSSATTPCRARPGLALQRGQCGHGVGDQPRRRAVRAPGSGWRASRRAAPAASPRPVRGNGDRDIRRRLARRRRRPSPPGHRPGAGRRGSDEPSAATSGTGSPTRSTNPLSTMPSGAAPEGAPTSGAAWPKGSAPNAGITGVIADTLPRPGWSSRWTTPTGFAHVRRWQQR